MRLLTPVGAVAVLAALLGAGASGASESRQRDCRVSQLVLSVGQEMSAATDHNPFSVHLTNRGRAPCVLNGYPGVSFSDGRGALPLVVKRTGDQQVTARRPQAVLVRPGQTAYVVLNKLRCDLGVLRRARTMRLTLLGAARQAGAVVDLQSLRGRLAYCRGGAELNAVHLSPFVPSVAAGLKRYPSR
jgi:hypothetical protein